MHTLAWDRHKNAYPGLGQAEKYIPWPGKAQKYIPWPWKGTKIHTLAWDRHKNAYPGLGQAQQYIPWPGTGTTMYVFMDCVSLMSYSVPSVQNPQILTKNRDEM
jgi:hypothetical protein